MIPPVCNGQKHWRDAVVAIQAAGIETPHAEVMGNCHLRLTVAQGDRRAVIVIPSSPRVPSIVPRRSTRDARRALRRIA